MNYVQLVDEIESYTENKFTKADIDTFIKGAEQRIYNQVQLPAIRKNVTGNATAGNKYLTCPSDWLATFSIAVIDPVTGEYEYLLNKDVNFIREAFPFPQLQESQHIMHNSTKIRSYWARRQTTVTMLNCITTIILLQLLMLVLAGLVIIMTPLSFMAACWKRIRS